MINPLEELSGCLPQSLYHFPFPPAVYEGSSFSISSTTLVTVFFLYFSHACECEIASHCGSDLHFRDD